ncbi:dihydrodipicolinate synthase family protein [Georgenia ruanii]|uniref:Dihydrodipicolinate synthase family protein n=1 Tax=Georgenia ruanii TaxID=348442 RepID=A0A7J9USJ6_9MICO|nr:dihydrodipicolinate synthase family protein [Georgenia ruanii]
MTDPTASAAPRSDLITAVPTPFLADGALDVPGTKRLFAALAARDVDGAFVAGTTGEFTTLDDDERLAVLDAGLEAFGAERAYLHVGAAHVRHAVKLTRAAVAMGGRKLAAITPYYFPAPLDAVVEYFRQVVDAADDAAVYAYLFTARTWTAVPHDALAALAEVGVAGVKISGESDESVATYLANAPAGFEVLSGNDIAYGELVRAGGQGIISGVSSVFPQPFLNLRAALRAGDDDAVSVATADVARAVGLVRAGSLTHLKAGLELQGLPAGPVRAAVETIPDEDRAAIAGELERWNQ